MPIHNFNYLWTQEVGAFRLALSSLTGSSWPGRQQPVGSGRSDAYSFSTRVTLSSPGLVAEKLDSASLTAVCSSAAPKTVTA